MTDGSSTDVARAFTIKTVWRDGTLIRVRPVHSNDKHLLEIGLEHLSKENRHFRFFSTVSELSEKLLCRFNEIDHVNHEAIGALDISEAPGNPVGVARYIRMPELELTAEVAVAVIDSHQGKGLGTLLLAFLSQGQLKTA